MYNILFALMLVHCTASSVYYFGSQSLMCLNGPLFSSRAYVIRDVSAIPI